MRLVQVIIYSVLNNYCTLWNTFRQQSQHNHYLHFQAPQPFLFCLQFFLPFFNVFFICHQLHFTGRMLILPQSTTAFSFLDFCERINDPHGIYCFSSFLHQMCTCWQWTKLSCRWIRVTLQSRTATHLVKDKGEKFVINFKLWYLYTLTFYWIYTLLLC